MENTFFSRYEALCRSRGETPNSVAKVIGASSGSVTAWKHGTEPRPATVAKIAEYFGVTTDFLLGTSPVEAAQVTEADIKFALFGGDCEITDEMYREVLQFARFIKHREQK